VEQIKHLLSVLATVEKHGDPETAAWFRKGCNHYLTGKDRTSFDKALGFASTRGKYTARTLFQRSERNRYIKNAFYCIDPDQGSTKRCELMAEAIRTFETRVYPRIKDLDAAPADMSELRQYLFMAKKTGAGLSTDWRTIYKWIYDI